MEFRLDEVFSLIDKVQSAGLTMFAYQDSDTKIQIKNTDKMKKAAVMQSAAAMQDLAVVQNTAQVQSAAAMQDLAVMQSAAAAQNLTTVEAPMVGTFYAAPAEDAAPYVAVGDTVTAGQTIGIIEAMKLMNEVTAECSGTIAEILVKNGELVEFGQPMFRIAEN